MSFLFDTEEQLIINKTTANVKLKNFSKANILQRFDFVLSMNNDNDIFNLYDGLKNKFEEITEKEWDNVKAFLPFAIPYSEEDLAG